MKFNILFLILILFSCEKKNEERINKQETTVEKKFTPKFGKIFFDFDEIEYYKIDISEDEAMNLFDNENKSGLEKLKFDVVLGEAPSHMKNLSFINNLEKIGFEKHKFEPTKYGEIKNIFTEKTVSESYASACVAVYRDVLVFRKNKKNIGMAKICFDCRQFRIAGTNADTENFGQDGDFEKLGSILRNP